MMTAACRARIGTKGMGVKSWQLPLKLVRLAPSQQWTSHSWQSAASSMHSLAGSAHEDSREGPAAPGQGKCSPCRSAITAARASLAMTCTPAAAGR